MVPVMVPAMAASASVPASFPVVPLTTSMAPPMHFQAAVEEAELVCNHCKKTFKSAGGLKYHLQNVRSSTIYKSMTHFPTFLTVLSLIDTLLCFFVQSLLLHVGMHRCKCWCCRYHWIIFCISERTKDCSYCTIHVCTCCCC